jgi:hypothetical protein
MRILILLAALIPPAQAQLVSPLPPKPEPIPHTSSENTEDLTTLSLAKSPLVPQPPLTGEIIETTDYTRELIRVQWRDGDPIDLYIILPKGVSHPPAILYLYSYPTETDRFRNDEFCRNVTRGGFAAVGFVSSLTGQRYHNVPMRQWFVSELASVLPITVHDVQMVLNYMNSRGNIDMNRIGIFGQGSGGTIAILSAATDPRIRAVDVIDPWGDWPDWLKGSLQIPEDERALYLDPKFLQSVAPFDPINSLHPMTKTPFRLQEALFNQAIPPAVRKKFAETAGIDRHVTYATPEEYKVNAANGALLSWLHKQLSSISSQR